MEQFDDQEEIASDEEVNNVYSEPFDSDSVPDDLDDPNGVKIAHDQWTVNTTKNTDQNLEFNGSQWQSIKRKKEEG